MKPIISFDPWQNWQGLLPDPQHVSHGMSLFRMDLSSFLEGDSPKSPRGPLGLPKPFAACSTWIVERMNGLESEDMGNVRFDIAGIAMDIWGTCGCGIVQNRWGCADSVDVVGAFAKARMVGLAAKMEVVR